MKAVITKSFGRIHRSNLAGMGVLPLNFKDGQDAGQTVKVVATAEDGKKTDFECVARLDTPNEMEYYRHGGLLQYVLRNKLS